MSYANILKMINSANNAAYAKVVMTFELIFMFRLMLVNDSKAKLF